MADDLGPDQLVELFFKIPVPVKECQRRSLAKGEMRSRRLAVAAVHPLGAAFAIAGPAGGIGLGRHELLGEALHHLPQQVRVILLCLRNQVSASKLSKATASLLSVVWTSKRLVRWSSPVVDPAPSGPEGHRLVHHP